MGAIGGQFRHLGELKPMENGLYSRISKICPSLICKLPVPTLCGEIKTQKLVMVMDKKSVFVYVESKHTG